MKHKEEKLVKVYQAKGEAEANLIKGLLESNGIPAILRSNAAPSVYAFVFDGMGQFDVLTFESLAEEAKTLLRGDESV